MRIRTELKIVDRNLREIKEGDTVVQYCGCCGKDIVNKGEVVFNKEEDKWVIRDYTTKQDSPLVAFSEDEPHAPTILEIVHN